MFLLMYSFLLFYIFTILPEAAHVGHLKIGGSGETFSMESADDHAIQSEVDPDSVNILQTKLRRTSRLKDRSSEEHHRHFGEQFDHVDKARHVAKKTLEEGEHEVAEALTEVKDTVKTIWTDFLEWWNNPQPVTTTEKPESEEEPEEKTEEDIDIDDMKKPSKATTRTTTTRKFSTTTIRKPTTTSTRKETTVSKPTTIVEKATTTKIVPTTTSKPTTRTSPMTKTSMTTTKASTTKISPTKKTPPTTKTPLTMKTPPMTNMPLTTKTPPTTKKPSTTKKLPEATTALEVAKPSTVAAANALSGVCGSSPCKNNGICREIRGKLTNSVQVFVGHVCLCQDRFTGYNCELEIVDYCTPNPCQNHGTCALLYESRRSKRSIDSYHAVGSLSSVDDAEVFSVPSGFACTCIENFHGETCDVVRPMHALPTIAPVVAPIAPIIVPVVPTVRNVTSVPKEIFGSSMSSSKVETSQITPEQSGVTTSPALSAVSEASTKLDSYYSTMETIRKTEGPRTAAPDMLPAIIIPQAGFIPDASAEADLHYTVTPTMETFLEKTGADFDLAQTAIPVIMGSPELVSPKVTSAKFPTTSETTLATSEDSRMVASTYKPVDLPESPIMAVIPSAAPPSDDELGEVPEKNDLSYLGQIATFTVQPITKEGEPQIHEISTDSISAVLVTKIPSDLTTELPVLARISSLAPLAMSTEVNSSRLGEIAAFTAQPVTKKLELSTDSFSAPIVTKSPSKVLESASPSVHVAEHLTSEPLILDGISTLALFPASTKIDLSYLGEIATFTAQPGTMASGPLVHEILPTDSVSVPLVSESPSDLSPVEFSRVHTSQSSVTESAIIAEILSAASISIEPADTKRPDDSAYLAEHSIFTDELTSAVTIAMPSSPMQKIDAHPVDVGMATRETAADVHQPLAPEGVTQGFEKMSTKSDDLSYLAELETFTAGPVTVGRADMLGSTVEIFGRGASTTQTLTLQSIDPIQEISASSKLSPDLSRLSKSSTIAPESNVRFSPLPTVIEMVTESRSTERAVESPSIATPVHELATFTAMPATREPAIVHGVHAVTPSASEFYAINHTVVSELQEILVPNSTMGVSTEVTSDKNTKSDLHKPVSTVAPSLVSDARKSATAPPAESSDDLAFLGEIGTFTMGSITKIAEKVTKGRLIERGKMSTKPLEGKVFVLSTVHPYVFDEFSAASPSLSSIPLDRFSTPMHISAEVSSLDQSTFMKGASTPIHPEADVAQSPTAFTNSNQPSISIHASESVVTEHVLSTKFEGSSTTVHMLTDSSSSIEHMVETVIPADRLSTSMHVATGISRAVTGQSPLVEFVPFEQQASSTHIFTGASTPMLPAIAEQAMPTTFFPSDRPIETSTQMLVEPLITEQPALGKLGGISTNVLLVDEISRVAIESTVTEESTLSAFVTPDRSSSSEPLGTQGSTRVVTEQVLSTLIRSTAMHTATAEPMVTERLMSSPFVPMSTTPTEEIARHSEVPSATSFNPENIAPTSSVDHESVTHTAKSEFSQQSATILDMSPVVSTVKVPVIIEPGTSPTVTEIPRATVSTSCSEEPCLNGGACQIVRGRLPDSKQFFQGYSCKCPAGYGGYDCELEPSMVTSILEHKPATVLNETPEISTVRSVIAFTEIAKAVGGTRVAEVPLEPEAECMYLGTAWDVYRSSLNKSLSGRTCLYWSMVDSDDIFDTPIDGPNHNYCRNPNRSPFGPWCYVKSYDGASVEKDRCVKRCKKTKHRCVSLDDNLKSYSERYGRTVSGRNCQLWSSQVPHKHSYGALLSTMANFCRNPDNNAFGPWCYTTDPNVRKEFCAPACPDDEE